VVARAGPKLTLRALLTLTDGLEWDEGDYNPASSDAAKMLFGPGRLDCAAYAAAKPQAFPPGTRWNYSTGSFVLAAAELQANLFPGARTPAARRAAMAGWMRASLFDPIGMTTALRERHAVQRNAPRFAAASMSRPALPAASNALRSSGRLDAWQSAQAI